MKQLLIILAIVSTLTTVHAQQKIEWRKDKVSQIIFPEPILKFRPGYTSDSALSQCDGRVMYIQPVGEMSETNLNVITSDGSYYAFNLVYNGAAEKVNYIISSSMAIFHDEPAATQDITSGSDPAQETTTKPDAPEAKEPEEQGLFAQVKKQGDYITSNNVAKLQKLTVLLRGVYVDQKYVYFRFHVENDSNIPFDVDYIAFSITAKTTKKTSTQERMQIQPVGVDNEIHRVAAKSTCEVVYAFEKFTIGKDKMLLAEVLEQGGDRNIGLRISESFIINARKL